MLKFEVETVFGMPPHPLSPIYKLRVDGRCHFDEFWEEMEKTGSQNKALEKMQAIMVQLCQGQRLPTTWFQELKHRGKNDPYPDFEIRSKRLRLYLFEDENTGKIIVLGELKKGNKTQDKAIKKMREIKLAYFASKT